MNLLDFESRMQTLLPEFYRGPLVFVLFCLTLVPLLLNLNGAMDSYAVVSTIFCSWFFAGVIMRFNYTGWFGEYFQTSIRGWTATIYAAKQEGQSKTEVQIYFSKRLFWFETPKASDLIPGVFRDNTIQISLGGWFRRKVRFNNVKSYKISIGKWVKPRNLLNALRPLCIKDGEGSKIYCDFEMALILINDYPGMRLGCVLQSIHQKWLKIDEPARQTQLDNARFISLITNKLEEMSQSDDRLIFSDEGRRLRNSLADGLANIVPSLRSWADDIKKIPVKRDRRKKR